MNRDEHIINHRIIDNLLNIKNPCDILNLAGGKFDPLFFNSLKDYNNNLPINNVVHLDRMYLNDDNIKDLVNNFDDYYNDKKVYYINNQIFDFLTRFQYKFDVITIYRYLEHVSKNDILYFIYLLSTTVKVGGLIDVIVPDYKKLAKRILEENVFDPEFERNDIITTFELLNEPYDPHASIWTKERIIKFWELEERFIVTNLRENYEFDGRDIYIRFIVKRIK